MGRRPPATQVSKSLGVHMQRMSAEEFMAQVLEDIQDLSPDLRKRLLEVARLSPATRVREIEKALEETVRG
jgi:hypothetical protein